MSTKHTHEPWTWVQPRNREELLRRLEEAVFLHVDERERENLCSVAHGEIVKLSAALQKAEATIADLQWEAIS